MKNILPIKIPQNRNFGLDLLRFIAIITVLISHSLNVLPPSFQSINKINIDGVLVFFVLSGFLIGRIFIRDFENGFSLKKIFNFWKMRWFRTLPAYYFTIIIILILSYLTSYPFKKIEVIKSLIFIQNFTSRSSDFFPESWSLSIEEWFYITLPLLTFSINSLLKVSIKKNILISIFIILLSSILFRYHVISVNNIKNSSLWDNLLRGAVVTRLDSILMGVFGAYVFYFHETFFKKHQTILFWIGISILLFNQYLTILHFENFGNFYFTTVYFVAVPFAILLTFPKFYYLKNSKNIFFTIITKTSIISYSLYLVNYTIVFRLILNPLNINHWIKFILFWGLTYSLAVLMYKFVETPFMKLRKKIHTDNYGIP